MANNEQSYGGGRRLKIEQTRGNSEEVGHVGNASRGLPPDGSHPTLPLQLSEELQKVDGELKTTEAVLESKILEIKKINEEKKAALAAQFAAEVTLRRVHAAQKDDDMPPIEAIIAPLESELKLARQEIAKLQDDNRALDRLTKSMEAALLEAEKKASLVDDLQNENQELMKQIEICLNEGSPSPPKPKPEIAPPPELPPAPKQPPDSPFFNRARFLLVEEDGITERSRTLAMANNEHSYGGGRRLAISPITCTSPPRPSSAPRPPPPEDGITERVQPASSPSKSSECVKPLSYVFFNEANTECFFFLLDSRLFHCFSFGLISFYLFFLSILFYFS